jgi:Mg-chelatase subunit ChlD
MGPSVKVVKKVLTGYLDRLGEGLNLKLMKYEDEPESLSDFTNDAGTLREAVAKEVRGGGGTDTFKGLLAAVDSLRHEDGNRAVLAIFDDLACGGGECLQYYSDLWNGILDLGVSFSTVAVQKGWDGKTSYYGNSQQRIFKEIAYSSRGQYFFSPSPETVEQSAEEIFNQLTSPVAYRLKAELSSREQTPGAVAILFEEGSERKAATNVGLILDASNSMWGQIEGKAKIAIAKEVLQQIIDGLPGQMHVGLRLYGHRYGLKDGKACGDTELVLPIEPLDKAKLKGAVEAITPRGKTPLVHAVLEGIKDFDAIGSGSIVLVSDGVESCNGDIEAIAPALKAAGLDLQVNIVGFDIKEAEARKQLEAIAASTGGTYLDARDSEQLMDSLEQTLRAEFLVLDSQGGLLARGTIGGDPVPVPAGGHTLRLLLEPEPVEAAITVKADTTSTLTLEKGTEGWRLR